MTAALQRADRQAAIAAATKARDGAAACVKLLLDHKGDRVFLAGSKEDPHGIVGYFYTTRYYETKATQLDAQIVSLKARPMSVNLALMKPATGSSEYASAYKAGNAVDGRTDGITTMLTFLVNAQHIPHFNDVPTGYSELGEDWLGTNNYLERQNYGLALALIDTFEFGSDPAAFLNANGVSTAPGNAEAIVDFLIDALFAGALTPAERQSAIDYLNTDSAGVPSPYDDTRIRETVAYLLGYPQFQEQ